MVAKTEHLLQNQKSLRDDPVEEIADLIGTVRLAPSTVLGDVRARIIGSAQLYPAQPRDANNVRTSSRNSSLCSGGT